MVDDEEVEEGVTLAVDVELEGAVLAEDVEDGLVLAVDVEFDGLFAEAEVEEAPFIVASLFARLPVLVFDIDEDCALFVLWAPNNPKRKADPTASPIIAKINPITHQFFPHQDWSSSLFIWRYFSSLNLLSMLCWFPTA